MFTLEVGKNVKQIAPNKGIVYLKTCPYLIIVSTSPKDSIHKAIFCLFVSLALATAAEDENDGEEDGQEKSMT